MMRLVLVCMAGQTPLRSTSPVHWPPSFGPCSKIVGSNPCERSQRAATSPPGPAPTTATVRVIGELSHGWDPGAISLIELTLFVADQATGLSADGCAHEDGSGNKSGCCSGGDEIVFVVLFGLGRLVDHRRLGGF